MCTDYRPQARRQNAWTLVEMMFAVGVFSLAAAALGSVLLFSVKSFASVANYATLDAESREAMDQLSKEIRQCKMVKSVVTNISSKSITLLSGDGNDVTYTFDMPMQQFKRTIGGDSKILLTNCNLLDFGLFQRTPSNGNYGVFPVASGSWTQSVKVIQLSWKTSRKVNTGPVNSETVTTARIVIRKQQDN